MVKKIKIYIFSIVAATLVLPFSSKALEMPATPDDLAAGLNLTALSYVVVDKPTGQVLLSRQPELPWTPASLTKLVTALVFLDTKPNMNKVVAIKQSDQDGGGCSVGGACISTKPGVSYRLKDLFYSSLIASANNATMAEARSTGLSQEEFVKRMNAKAKTLGAYNTHFVEPTGMSPANITTVSDYAKIAAAAFALPTIQKIDALTTYSFSSYNNKKYKYTIKNTNKLLGSQDFAIVGGKTGYLEESKYNFVAEVKDKFGNNSIVVIFGSQNGTTQFAETRELIMLSALAKSFAGSGWITPPGGTAGTSTLSAINR